MSPFSTALCGLVIMSQSKEPAPHLLICMGCPRAWLFVLGLWFMPGATYLPLLWIRLKHFNQAHWVCGPYAVASLFSSYYSFSFSSFLSLASVLLPMGCHGTVHSALVNHYEIRVFKKGVNQKTREKRKLTAREWGACIPTLVPGVDHLTNWPSPMHTWEPES